MEAVFPKALLSFHTVRPETGLSMPIYRLDIRSGCRFDYVQVTVQVSWIRWIIR